MAVTNPRRGLPAAGLATDRLLLREAVADDADFLCRLMNEPAWRRFIGEHAVTTPEDAAAYLAERYYPAYRQGIGLWIVALRQQDAPAVPIGVCGLVQRTYLPDPDIGFAFLEAWRGGGYAFEAAMAVLELARTRLGAARVAAITVPGNHASIRLLERLGFRYAGSVVPPDASAALSVYESFLAGDDASN